MVAKGISQILLWSIEPSRISALVSNYREVARRITDDGRIENYRILF